MSGAPWGALGRLGAVSGAPREDGAPVVRLGAVSLSDRGTESGEPPSFALSPSLSHTRARGHTAEL